MKEKIFLLSFILSITLSSAPVLGACNNPPTGNWLVGGTEVCEDTLITLNGNLTINQAGNLTFSNVTFVMNCSFNGEYVINNSGNFTVNNSGITSANTSSTEVNFGWWNFNKSRLEIRDSYLNGFGWYDSNEPSPYKNRGLFINTNNTILTGNNISYPVNFTNTNKDIYLVYLYGSWNGTLSGNNITVAGGSGGAGDINQIDPVFLSYSNGNNITGNAITINVRYGDGVHLIESHSNIVYNNTFDITGDNARGIYIYGAQSGNNTLENNDIRTYPIGAVGIYLYYQVYNTTIRNNTINFSATSIFIDNSLYTIMRNNALIRAPSSRPPAFTLQGSTQDRRRHGIDTSNTIDGKPILYLFNQTDYVIEDTDNYSTIIVFDSDNVTIDNVTLTIDPLTLYNTSNSVIKNSNITLPGFSCLYATAIKGIYIAYGSNNTLENSTVTTRSRAAEGIRLENADSSNITGNTVLADHTCGHNGNVFIIVMENSKNNTVFKNAISTNSMRHGGIYMYNSYNNNFTLNTINTSDLYAYGLYVRDSDGNTLYDSTINSTDDYDIYVRGSGNTTLINTTFNQSDIYFYSGSTGNVTVRWYLDVYVQNGTGDPVNQSGVEGRDTYSTLAFSELTNSSGVIGRKLLTQFWRNASQAHYYTDYTITATKSGYAPDSASLNLDRSLLLTITLTTPPVVYEPKTYTNALVEKNMFRPGRVVKIRVSVTDPDGREDIDSVLVDIFDSEDVLRVNDGAMSDISQAVNGYVYEYDYLIPQDSHGVWLINITASDHSGNIGHNSTSFAVINMTIQVRLVLNDTSAKIYIPGEGEKTASSLTSLETYTNPPHYYLASYINNVMKGLVFYQRIPLSMFTDGDPDNYTLGNDLDFSNSMVFLVFSKGDWKQTDNRADLIEKAGFLSYPEPSFAFGLGDNAKIKIALEYDNIDLAEKTQISRGHNELYLKHEGLAGDKIRMRIERA